MGGWSLTHNARFWDTEKAIGRFVGRHIDFINDKFGAQFKVVIAIRPSSENRAGQAGIRTDWARIRTDSTENRTDVARIRTDDVVSKAIRKLLVALGDDELFTIELMSRLRIRSRGALFVTYIKPGLENGLIEMRYPDTSRTKKQAYRLTGKGLSLLRNMSGDNNSR